MHIALNAYRATDRSACERLPIGVTGHPSNGTRVSRKRSRCVTPPMPGESGSLAPTIARVSLLIQGKCVR